MWMVFELLCFLLVFRPTQRNALQKQRSAIFIQNPFILFSSQWLACVQKVMDLIPFELEQAPLCRVLSKYLGSRATICEPALLPSYSSKTPNK